MNFSFKKNNLLSVLYLSLLLFLSACGSSGGGGSSDSDDTTSTKTESLSISGTAFKEDGTVYPINTQVLAVDMNGNVAEGKVKNNQGEYELVMTAIASSGKKSKGLGGDIILRVGSSTTGGTLTILIPGQTTKTKIVINFNSIISEASKDALKNIDLDILFQKVVTALANKEADLPATLSTDDQADLIARNIKITQAELEASIKEVTDLLFGVDAVNIDFLSGNLDSETVTEILVDVKNNLELLALYTITTSSDKNGTISQSSIVNSGATVTVLILPNLGYEIDEIKVDQKAVANASSYTFSNITADHSISVSFKLKTFSITTSAGPEGSITETFIKNFGSDLTVTITPNEGYELSVLTVDGASVAPALSYTFSNISANHTISATFKIKVYSISLAVGDNGSITASSTANHGSDAVVTINANTGYEIDILTVDGVKVTPVATYTFTAVASNHSLSVTFKKKTLKITTIKGVNGTISPTTFVNYGDNATVTITPNTNFYKIDVLTVDGITIPATSTYTFTNVIIDHTVAVTFKENKFNITTISDANGTISGTAAVNYGSDIVITMTPNPGYVINVLTVDGTSVTSTLKYTLSNVTKDQTISVTYKLETVAPTVLSVNSPVVNGPFKFGDIIPIHVLFSEPVVVTNTPTLILETGAIDRLINYSSGSGADTLIFNYTVQNGDVATDLDCFSAFALALSGGTIRDAALNAAILTLPAPGATNSLGANKAIQIDGTKPTIVNVSSSTANASYKVGNTITIQVVFSEIVFVTNTPTLTIETGATDRIINYSGGSGTTTLVFSYIVQNGDVSPDLDYTLTSALAFSGGTITDTFFNSAILTLPAPGAVNSLSANKNIIIDTVSPTITSITSSTANGYYKAGSNISVKIIFSEVISLVGTMGLNLNSGGVVVINAFTGTSADGTYTVLAGHTSSDLTTTSVTVNTVARDAALNSLIVTLPATNIGSGSDIVIDTTAPTITSITSSTADGAYKVGSNVAIRINFSEMITVVGVLNINLDSGGTAVINAFTGTTATGVYSVLASQTSADLTTSSVSVGTTARDAALNDMVLTLPATNIAVGSNIIIDTTIPTISSIVSLSADGNYGLGSSVSVRINFSETISLVGTMGLNLDSGGIVVISPFSGTTTTGLYTVLVGHSSLDLTVSSVTVNTTARDAALNDLNTTLPVTNIAVGSNIFVDGNIPTISSITSSTTDGSYKVGDVISIRINCSETITLVGTMGINLDSGGVCVISAFTGTTVTGSYTVLAGHSSSDLTASSVTVNSTARDAALNNLNTTLPVTNIHVGSNLLIDGIVPTITSITSSTANGSYKAGGNIAVRINFSETITLVGTMGLNLNSGGVCVISAFTGTTATGVYTVLAGHNSADLTVSSIVVNTTARDAALNNLDTTLPGTNIANGSNIVIDTTVPTITSITSSTVDGTYKLGDNITIRINFSETITQVGTLGINLDSGGVCVINAFSGTTTTGIYTVLAGHVSADVTATSVVVNTTARDGALNNLDTTLPATNIGVGSNLVIDGLVPTITSITSSTANGSYKAGDIITIQVNFSESITLVGTMGVNLNTGGVCVISPFTGATTSGSYTILAGHNNADLSVTSIVVNTTARDSALNNLNTTVPITNIDTGSNLVIDTTAPTISSITSLTADGAYTAPATISVIITFSEPVTIVGTVDINLDSGGTVVINAFTGTTTSGVYTILGGHVSADLTATGVIVNVTVRDAALNDLVITLPATNIATGSDISVF